VSRRLAGLGLVALVAGSLVACGTLGYTVKALGGGASILVRRHSIARLLARPDLPVEERRRLTTALAVRDFASRELALPDNRSYRSYVELGRDYATWNVVAAPPLSLEPRRWCFPVAGCVSYRGYFRRAGAERFAARLTARGDDVTVQGAIAYSTLGWFADPLLDTFFTGADWQLAGLLFHELAHQEVYVPDDTAFNESFATTVEELGVERWIDEHGDPALAAEAARSRREEAALLRLLLAARGELATLYAGDLPAATKLARKQEIFAGLRDAIRHRRDAGELSERFDGWQARPLNNADLAAVADYEIWVPAFRALFAQSAGFPAFYAAVLRLADAPPEARRRRLAELAPATATPGD